MTNPILAKIEETIEAIGADSSLTALQAARHTHTLTQLRKALAADFDKAMTTETLDSFVGRFASFDAQQSRDQGEAGYLPVKRASEVTGA